MDLERKIFELVFRATQDEVGNFNATDCARAILAIPEIRDALNGVRPVGGYWERTGTGKGARKWVPAP